MEKNRLQERLVALYLRLNGFFQTGLIVHSEEHGNNRTEIDRIAVRFPHHRQDDRQVDFCEKLGKPGAATELLIVEVKNGTPVFNPALHDASRNPASNLEKILSWAGLFDSSEMENITSSLITSLRNSKNGVYEPVHAGTAENQINVQPISVSFEGREDFINAGGIVGQDVIDYIWQCLCPGERRPTCSTTYAFNNWGYEYEDLVTFFKERDANPSIEEVYIHFNIATA